MCANGNLGPAGDQVKETVLDGLVAHEGLVFSHLHDAPAPNVVLREDAELDPLDLRNRPIVCKFTINRHPMEYGDDLFVDTFGLLLSSIRGKGLTPLPPMTPLPLSSGKPLKISGRQ